ncbi:MAG: amidohydrolase family protein [Saprospiraceae bacterium]
MQPTFIATFLLLFTLTLAAQNNPPGPAQTGPIAVTGVTAHLGNGKVVEGATILFKDGKIERVGTEAAPAGYTVVNAMGKHAYPGAIALNSDLGLVEINAVRATQDGREVGTFNPHGRSQIAFNTDSRVTPTVRSRGILLAQPTPSGGLISGRSSVMQLDGWNYEDATVRADDGVHLNWPNRLSYNWRTGELSPNKNYDEQLTEFTNYLKQARAYCSAAGAAERGPVNLDYAALCPAFSAEANAYLHVDQAADIQAGIILLKSMGMKPVIYGGDEAYRIADFLKKEQVSVVLNNVHALPGLADDPIHQPFLNPRLLAEAGVPFALSVGGGWEQRNLLFNAGTAVGNGLDYEAAVRAVTLEPARILGIDDRYGSLEAGKSATLFISSGDALDMRTSVIEMAWIDGRPVNLENKQDMLYEKFRGKYGEGKE